MAEPARKMPPRAHRPYDGPTVYRPVEHSDGRVEVLELPLTPELFLDPQVGDQMTQGRLHWRAVFCLFDLLDHRFRSHPDVLILSDVKLLVGAGIPGPAPDIAVLRGVPSELDRDRGDEGSFDVVRTGISPCLVIEVVSPKQARIRRVDEKDKVLLYQRIGIPEYLLLDLPRPANRRRYGFRGYRLDSFGRYRPLQPDAEGFLLSETTGLRFGASPQADRIMVIDVESGQPLRSSAEEEQRAAAAEERADVAEARAAREAEARKRAEEDLARLRAELEHLRG